MRSMLKPRLGPEKRKLKSGHGDGSIGRDVLSNFCASYLLLVLGTTLFVVYMTLT